MAGYDKLARLIADHPSLAIYRKFGLLSSKILLYMQAELVNLENELEILVQDDDEEDEKASFKVSWKAMSSASCENGADLQHRKVVNVQEKLRAYRTMRSQNLLEKFSNCLTDAMLLQSSRVRNLAKPRPSDLFVLQEWLEEPRGGDCFLEGIEADPWDPMYEDDLITLTLSEQEDHLAKYLGDRLAPWYHHCIRPQRKQRSEDQVWKGFAEYSERIFVAIGNVTSMVLASLIPNVSIFALCFVESMVARLVVITVMSFLFSFIMTIVTRAGRAEVFAATTAFAAVLVVFVGGFNH